MARKRNRGSASPSSSSSSSDDSDAKEKGRKNSRGTKKEDKEREEGEGRNGRRGGKEGRESNGGERSGDHGAAVESAVALAGEEGGGQQEGVQKMSLMERTIKQGKAGGAYIPPFRLKQMMQEAQDKSSPEYQRATWEGLKKSINGLVNRVTKSNITSIIQELFSHNLVRARGLYARSVMKAQLASPAFSPVRAPASLQFFKAYFLQEVCLPAFFLSDLTCCICVRFITDTAAYTII